MFPFIPLPPSYLTPHCCALWNGERLAGLQALPGRLHASHLTALHLIVIGLLPVHTLHRVAAGSCSISALCSF